MQNYFQYRRIFLSLRIFLNYIAKIRIFDVQQALF